jgi:hypothetical protein
MGDRARRDAGLSAVSVSLGIVLTHDLCNQARIALLEGERRSFDNVKVDLMRRIKMLEYALRMERSVVVLPHTRDASEYIPPGQSNSRLPQHQSPLPSWPLSKPNPLVRPRAHKRMTQAVTKMAAARAHPAVRVCSTFPTRPDTYQTSTRVTAPFREPSLNVRNAERSPISG